MRLRQIEVFHAVYSSGSVTRAAEALNVSQPSVSKVLKHAEQQLGYALFERAHGKLRPTPEADRLFANVAAVYTQIDQLRRVAENLRGVNSGRIRVAANPAFGISLLPQAIATFQREYANALFVVETLHSDEITARLLGLGSDVGLSFEPSLAPGVIEDVLGYGRFFLIAPEGMEFSHERDLTFDDLARLPFIQFADKGPLGRTLSTYLESSGIVLNTVAYADTYQVAKAMVSQGVGITIADEITARAPGHSGLRIWPFSLPARFRISALRLEAAPKGGLIDVFVGHLEETVRTEFAAKHP